MKEGLSELIVEESRPGIVTLILRYMITICEVFRQFILA